MNYEFSSTYNLSMAKAICTVQEKDSSSGFVQSLENIKKEILSEIWLSLVKVK